MPDPIKIITIGGVKFEAVDVVNYTERRNLRDNTGSNMTRYYVTLRTGVTINFNRQADKNLSAVDVDEDDVVRINRIFGMTLKGSENRDDIELNGCRNSILYLDNDEPKGNWLDRLFQQTRSDYVEISDSQKNGKLYKSAYNEVHLGPQDSVNKVVRDNEGEIEAIIGFSRNKSTAKNATLTYSEGKPTNVKTGTTDDLK